MNVHWITSWEQLANYASVWNQLAGQMPLRRWEWLAGWWRYYGQLNPRRRLAVAVVKEPDGSVIGLAPWYVEDSALRGRIVRFLGDEELCTDHLTLLCLTGREQAVAHALAQGLTSGTNGRSPETSPWDSKSGNGSTSDSEHESSGRDLERYLGWDLLELSHVDMGDPALEALARAMADRGCWVDRAQTGRCWVIPLPDTWEAFLKRLSNSHRSRLRRVSRHFFTTGRAVFHTVQNPDQLLQAMDLLVRLHRCRRRQLGQPDRFVSERFEAFHRQLAPTLLEAGLLHLHWLEVDGAPVAVEYHPVGDKTIYAYQSGIAPTEACSSPGEWIHLAAVRRAIEHGYQRYDFLRGDEPYKAHWRAEPQPTETFWMVAPHASAACRYGLHRTARRIKQWLKRWLRGETNLSSWVTQSCHELSASHS